MRNKILNFDFNEIHNEIHYYKKLHNGLDPIMLINNNTLEYAKELVKDEIKKPVTEVFICGCKIAIADWLPFGEVELR